MTVIIFISFLFFFYTEAFTDILNTPKEKERKERKRGKKRVLERKEE